MISSVSEVEIRPRAGEPIVGRSSREGLARETGGTSIKARGARAMAAVCVRTGDVRGPGPDHSPDALSGPELRGASVVGHCH